MPYDATVVTVGTFDGVHKGHQDIIAKVNKESRRLGAASVLSTFEPHPRLVIQRKNLPPITLLTTMDEKIHALQNLGIDCLVVSEFTREFASTPAELFVRETLVKKIKMRSIVIGHDHAFGRNREGDENLLKTLGRELDFQVHVVKPRKFDDGVISSSSIRRALQDGDIEQANKYLGRAYSVGGQVVKGREQGRKLGFPTANIHIGRESKLAPKPGIYATSVVVSGRSYKSVTYIGARPTFQGDELVVEVHIDDFDKDIYGEQITINFHSFLRNDQQFFSKEELAKSIKQDKKNALKFLDDGGIK